MGRSGDSGDSGEEPGKLIRFPRSGSAREEGVEPASGARGSTSQTIEPPADSVEVSAHESGTREAIDFWGTEVTQHFVGSSKSEGDVGQVVAGEQPRDGARSPTRPGVPWRRRVPNVLSVPLVAPLAALLLVVVVSGGTAAVVEVLTGGEVHKASPRALVAGAGHALHRSPLWFARSVVRHSRVRRGRAHLRRSSTVPKRRPSVSSTSPNAVIAVSLPSSSTGAPSYEAPSSGATRTRSASSSRRGTAGPTGRVSLIGAGTTPSG